MPRIPENNPRYRTKAELCSDLAFILNSTVKYGTQFAVLSEATWVWTEFGGKYDGCQYWSKGAWELRGQEKLLTHEHVIPKSIIIDQLRQLPNPTADSVSHLLTSYCKGAVITRAEDAHLNKCGFRAKMPAGWSWSEGDVWARYTSAGISLYSPCSGL